MIAVRRPLALLTVGVLLLPALAVGGVTTTSAAARPVSGTAGTGPAVRGFVGPLTADRTPAERLTTTTPLKHVVSLMQENHSFDNYFGTYPGVEGIRSKTCMPRDPERPAAGCVRPYRLGNRPISDLGHNRTVYDAQVAGGAMNGFVSAFARQGIQDPTQAMGHYDDRDIPWYWNVADNYVLFDHNFTSSHGGSISNHMFWTTGQSGLPANGLEVIPKAGFEVPTIFDRLQESGVSWKFYVQNYDPQITFRNRAPGDRGAQVVWVPLLAMPRVLDDPALFGHIVPIEQYYDDLAAGTLPAVSYIVPSGASEHPPGSIAAGEAFVRTLVTSLQRSSAWPTSAFLWSYDDWGGWFDHVRPPSVDPYGYGFRAPMLMISPYARRGFIDRRTADFTSQLALIERNWGIAPLTARDRNAYPLTDAFDFGSPGRPAVILPTTRTVEPVVLPRRNVVYASYGAAALVFLTVLVLAALLAPRRRVIHLPTSTVRLPGLPLAPWSA